MRDLSIRNLMWLPSGSWQNPSRVKPFYTFIIKVASRCNIDCDYCYVYRGLDQSWRKRPKFIDDNVLRQTAFRINEHVKKHQLKEIAIAFHGGEPLLIGHTRFRKFLEILKAGIDCVVKFGIQTNAVLVDEGYLDLFVAENIKVGISLDGNRAHNDRHRLGHDGTSSYDLALRGIQLMQSRTDWRQQLSGFLVFVDLKNDPIEVLKAFVALEAESFDLLLPHMNHDDPPPRPSDENRDTAYGRWMANIFDVWYQEYPQIRINIFDDLLALSLGGRSYSEALAATCVDLVIVETDGSIEAVDTLKIVGEFATSLQMNVFNSSFDEAALHPAMYSRMIGFEALCETCRSCDKLKSCGGGYIPHRFSKSNGFLNPSVYCSDLKFLIDHVGKTVAKTVVA